MRLLQFHHGAAGRWRSDLSAHILVGEPASTPDQARGRLSPEYALAARLDRRSAPCGSRRFCALSPPSSRARWPCRPGRRPPPTAAQDRGARRFADRRPRAGASDAFPVRLAAGAQRQGDRRRGRQRRRLRRHHLGRARAARLVGAGRHRRRDPRARRQRHAARPRSGGHARRARHRSCARSPARNIAVLLCGMLAPRQHGRRLRRAPSTRSIRSSPRPTARCSIRSSSTALPPIPSSTSGDGLHPTAAGVDVIVAKILPKVEELLARVRARHGTRAGDVIHRCATQCCCVGACKSPHVAERLV